MLFFANKGNRTLNHKKGHKTNKEWESARVWRGKSIRRAMNIQWWEQVILIRLMSAIFVPGEGGNPIMVKLSLKYVYRCVFIF